MMAFLWGAAWGAGAFACLRAACGRITRGEQPALPMLANMGLIAGCLLLWAWLSPGSLAFAGIGLAAALILGAALQALGVLSRRRKEDANG